MAGNKNASVKKGGRIVEKRFVFVCVVDAQQ